MLADKGDAEEIINLVVLEQFHSMAPGKNSKDYQWASLNKASRRSFGSVHHSRSLYVAYFLMLQGKTKEDTTQLSVPKHCREFTPGDKVLG